MEYYTVSNPKVKPFYTFKELKELGFPYSWQWLYEMEFRGLFPKRRKLVPGAGGKSRVGWSKKAVDDWFEHYHSRFDDDRSFYEASGTSPPSDCSDHGGSR